MSSSRAQPRGRTKKRRKKNPGWFKKGFDARRSSYRFTASDCRVGWLVANCKHPELREWLKMKIRVYYHERSKHGKESEEGTTATLEPPAETPLEAAPETPISPSEGNGDLQPEAPPPSGHKHLPVFKVGPIASDRNNFVSAAVWANQIDAKDGRSFTVYNVTFEATWRDADGSWKATRSYRGSMLYVLMHCIARCNDWILSQRDPQAEIPF